MENDNQQNPSPHMPQQRSGDMFIPQPAISQNSAAIPPSNEVPPFAQQKDQTQQIIQPQAFSQDNSRLGQDSLISPPMSITQPPTINTIDSTVLRGKPKTKGIIIAAALALVIIGMALAFLGLRNNKSSGIVSSNGCTPPVASSVDKAVAITAYTTFTSAIKRADQSCVDNLSSNHLKQYEAQLHPTVNGNWITAKGSILPSMTDRLSSLPTSLNNSEFIQAEYTQAVTLDKLNATPPVGITLKYPLSGANNIQYHLNISFILEGGKIVADEILLSPISLEK